MKILLKECEQKLELAERHFEEWKKIQTKLNQRIAHLGSGHFNRDTYINALTEEEKIKLNELHVYFESIRW